MLGARQNRIATMGRVSAPPETEDEAIKTPGDFVRAEMEARGWSQPDLAFVLGVNAAAVNQILKGKRGISTEMANALGSAFDMPADTFAKIQAEWDVRNAAAPDPRVLSRARVQSQYPLREMIKRGWVRSDVEDDIETQLCRFFGVGSLSDVPHLAHAGKKTQYSHIPAAQLAWLFRVKKIASEMPTPIYSKDRLNQAIERMRMMLESPEEIRHVPRLLHEAGVRFVVVEALPASKIDGVCFWLDNNSPVIGMSLRYDRIDNFWFVLRHECAHVLHGHGKDSAIVDSELEIQGNAVNDDERVANEEASEFSVPQVKMQSFYQRKKPFFAEREVLAFAKIMKVHPGIVVGQLHRILGRYDLLRTHLVRVRNHVASAAMVDGWGDIIPVES
jgi:HTH-type transcriptional regulator/antitoxin HigA